MWRTLICGFSMHTSGRKQLIFFFFRCQAQKTTSNSKKNMNNKTIHRRRRKKNGNSTYHMLWIWWFIYNFVVCRRRQSVLRLHCYGRNWAYDMPNEMKWKIDFFELFLSFFSRVFCCNMTKGYFCFVFFSPF